MFILIVGSGRVGSAVAKRALASGHEVSVLDSDPLSHERLDKDQTTTWEDSGGRFTVGTALEIDAMIEAGIEQADVFLAATSGDNTNLVIAQIAQRRFDVPRVVVRVAEPEHAVQYGDATELWVLERAGIQRADLVIAVTGDDEDNILICQVAREKYGRQRIVARVNNPRNLQHFKLLGIQPAVSATDLILRLIEHEVPEYGLVQLLALEEEHLEIIEVEVGEGSTAAGRRVQDVPLPDGSLIISVLRGGAGFVPKADSVIEAGDQVLLILDPGLESSITPQFAPNGATAGA